MTGAALPRLHQRLATCSEGTAVQAHQGRAGSSPQWQPSRAKTVSTMVTTSSQGSTNVVFVGAAVVFVGALVVSSSPLFGVAANVLVVVVSVVVLVVVVVVRVVDEPVEVVVEVKVVLVEV
eukprot:CAMPEP_0206493336 /NCGR_PEP_ID=MMETSP0324_2-20121206/46889_1 /ASSEMBLY_ACC=CAM_ASM_000836 /TAXON_ID=2866 /ORGANISM="Crypthecodinium cohnii, Strain Seligo" /LENGTH=120 /DNA_ID=CAMNT_0053976415 /DNA_START=181 /DNA_END=543 /DNA_ORIENTATION=-